MVGSLTNRRNVKKYIKAQLEAKRPHLGIHRVSHKVYPKLEAMFRAMIDRSIMSHPSKGKTFKEII